MPRPFSRSRSALCHRARIWCPSRDQISQADARRCLPSAAGGELYANEHAAGAAVRRVVTVAGLVAPESLAPILMHEHVIADLSEHWHDPPGARRRALRDAPVAPELLASLRRYPFSTTRDNLTLGDEASAAGGACSVERAHPEFSSMGREYYQGTAGFDFGKDSTRIARSGSCSTRRTCLLGSGLRPLAFEAGGIDSR
jgi:hypothetical protein